MKLKPSGYVTAEASRKPGYLARRMAEYRKRLQAEKDAKDANAAEAAQKTRTLKPRKQA